MKMTKEIPALMLAPCGINCEVCYVHLKTKKPCFGCRGQDNAKPEHCRKCKLKDCVFEHNINFCFDCSSFPCMALKRLDKSYRQRYQVSLVENGKRINAIGAIQFLDEERERWTCSVCGGVISLHDGVCSECGKRK